MRHAVLTACAEPETRADGYSVANRIFSSLYTSMRAREAVEILEGALASGDGPPAMGAQIARRAGIAASEMRGTYEGLWLLDRADAARLLGAPPRGAAVQDRLHPGRDAPRRRRPGQRRVRGQACDRPRPGRLDHPPGHPHAGRRLRLPGSFRRGHGGRRRRDARAHHRGRAMDRPVAAHRAGPDRPRAGPHRRGRRRHPGRRRRGPRARGGPGRAARRDAPAQPRPDVGAHRRRTGDAALGRPPPRARPGRARPAGQGRRQAGCRTRRRRGGPGRLRAGWAATRSTPACSSAARWSTSATSTRPRRRTSPHSTTAAPCACRCAPPTCSTGSPGSRAGTRPLRGAVAGRGCLRAPHAAQGGALGLLRRLRRRAGRAGTRGVARRRRPVRRRRSRSSRPSSAGPRPHDRRCSTRSRPPSARSPSGWRTG